MIHQVQDGQCGLCAHFGEHHPNQQQLTQIRISAKAPDEFVDECGHPAHAQLHLRVTPISGCDGFEPAQRPGYGSSQPRNP
jgi:hypothetical protein